MKYLGSVAGITFRNKDASFESMRPSGEVTFVHEPTNEFDPNAIQIYWKKVFLGYVGSDTLLQQILKGNEKITTGSIEGFGYATGQGKDLQFNNNYEGRLSAVQYSVTEGDDEGDIVMTEDNCYLIDGQKFQRLSSVLSSYDFDPKNTGLERWKIDNFESYNAYRKELDSLANDGTVMHNAIDRYIQTGVKSDEIPDGFWKFCKKFNVVFLSSEMMIIDKETGIAGRCDALAQLTFKIKGKTVTMIVLLDWKSSKKVNKKQKAQVGWYGFNYDDEAGNVPDEAWVVALGSETKQGFSLGKVNADEMGIYDEVIANTKASIDLLNG